jgi:hypothetical protein
MYIVTLAWLYVTLMMAVVEASASNGTVLGAVITFVLYGLLPISILLYIMGTPARRRAIKARELTELQATRAATQPAPADSAAAPDTDGKTPANPVTPVRKEA